MIYYSNNYNRVYVTAFSTYTSTLILSSKISEYIAIGKPIFSICNDNSPIYRILKETTHIVSKYQKEASDKVCDYVSQGYDVLLNSVCGSGKTEIVVECIKNYISKGLKVCYAIARREVVVELTERFQNIFKDADVIGVYGGHHDKIFGDLIVCTSHQLFRYYHNFDLLILDEVDAFPLKGNETLMNISLNSCKGHIVFSTATVDENLKSILKSNYRLLNK